MASKDTDITPEGVSLYFLPVRTRVPLKFGRETLTHVTCARVRLTVRNAAGSRAEGWGETPLSVQWAWPAQAAYQLRHEAMKAFTTSLASAWASPGRWGHPIELGHAFAESVLPDVLAEFNAARPADEAMPHLAALICCSPFDIALHDAYGRLHGVDVYRTYDAAWMNADLSAYLDPDEGSGVSFSGKYPADFLVRPRADELTAWHLVGGRDPIDEAELSGAEPDDGYPVLLRDWIRRDALKCLKVKLRGTDAAWDYDRLVGVGRLGREEGVEWLSSDFNCTVTDPAYVNGVLDRLRAERPEVHEMVLYVEQPFPYDLHANSIDVRSVAARKPLFMDESAHDWRLIRMGRGLGWTGVALKTCKTQTGALLSLCWAKAHGMALMVQDLTNPMLAQIAHCLLAAHAGTIMGVETNSMQFYPEASLPEAAVHPGLYARRGGKVSLASIAGAGFGYRLEEIDRELPAPAASTGGVSQ